ncbi:MAG: FtsL-like putative cell division protein [Bacteroidota bacterium]
MANKFRDKKTEELEELEELVEQEEPQVAAKPSKPGKKGVLAKGLSKIFGGAFLSDERAVQHVPFILFLGFIAILYIANGYYADDKIREENKIKNEIKELRTEYISTTSEKMFVSKQSEVAKAVEPLGLKEPVVAPMKIETDSTEIAVNTKP